MSGEDTTQNEVENRREKLLEGDPNPGTEEYFEAVERAEEASLMVENVDARTHQHRNRLSLDSQS